MTARSVPKSTGKPPSAAVAAFEGQPRGDRGSGRAVETCSIFNFCRNRHRMIAVKRLNHFILPPAHFAGTNVIRSRQPVRALISAMALMSSFIAAALGQELIRDAHTLMLLHFDGSVVDALGTTPTRSGVLQYGTGVVRSALITGPGTQLVYPAVRRPGSIDGSIEFWVKPGWDDAPATNVCLVEAIGAQGGGFILRAATTGSLQLAMRGDDPATPGTESEVEFTLESASIRWVAGTWHHVAATWSGSGSACTLFLDGGIVATTTSAVRLVEPASGALSLAARPDGTEPATVNLDELRISDIARDPNEIQRDYQVGIHSMQPPSITGQPENSWVRVGEDGGFVVEVDSVAPVTFQWRKESLPVVGAIGKRAMLVLTNVGPLSTGLYDVIATNQWGSITSHVASLSLLPALSIAAQSAVAFGQTNQVIISFSRRVNTNSLNIPANFQLPAPFSITSILPHPRHKDMVLLGYSGVDGSRPREVTISGIMSVEGATLDGRVSIPIQTAPAMPADVGENVAGFQDDFTGTNRNPLWVQRGRYDHQNALSLSTNFFQERGVLRITPAAPDPTHLLFEAPGYNATNQEVLVRMRVTKAGNDDFFRGGPALCASYQSGDFGGPKDFFGLDYVFRNGGNGNSKFGTQLLADYSGWGAVQPVSWKTNEWYWLRVKSAPDGRPGKADLFSRFWAADGTTPEPAVWEEWDRWPWSARGTLAGWEGPTTNLLYSGFAGITPPVYNAASLEVDYFLLKAEGLPQIVVDPQPTDQPVLSIRKALDGITVGWSPLYTGYSLEYQTNGPGHEFAHGSWQPVSAPTPNNTFSPPPDLPGAFFRLILKR